MLELGGGCGVVTAILLAAWPSVRAVSVELQEPLHEASIRTARANGLTDRWEQRSGDLKTLGRADLGWSPDLAVANPPFFAADRGRRSPDPVVAGARHEILGRLEDFLDAARRCLAPERPLFLTWPAARLAEALTSVESHRFRPRALQLVHPRPDAPANRFLLEVRKASRAPLDVLPPLVVHADGGGYGSWYEDLKQNLG